MDCYSPSRRLIQAGREDHSAVTQGMALGVLGWLVFKKEKKTPHTVRPNSKASFFLVAGKQSAGLRACVCVGGGHTKSSARTVSLKVPRASPPIRRTEHLRSEWKVARSRAALRLRSLRRSQPSQAPPYERERQRRRRLEASRSRANRGAGGGGGLSRSCITDGNPTYKEVRAEEERKRQERGERAGEAWPPRRTARAFDSRARGAQRVSLARRGAQRRATG